MNDKLGDVGLHLGKIKNLLKYTYFLQETKAQDWQVVCQIFGRFCYKKFLTSFFISIPEV